MRTVCVGSVKEGTCDGAKAVFGCGCCGTVVGCGASEGSGGTGPPGWTTFCTPVLKPVANTIGATTGRSGIVAETSLSRVTAGPSGYWIPVAPAAINNWGTRWRATELTYSSLCATHVVRSWRYTIPGPSTLTIIRARTTRRPTVFRSIARSPVLPIPVVYGRTRGKVAAFGAVKTANPTAWTSSAATI